MTEPFFGGLAARSGALFLATVAGLAGCSRSGFDDRPLPPPTPETVRDRFDQARSGQAVDVTVGVPFAIELSSNFEWREAERPAFIARPDIVWGPTIRAQIDGATGGANWQVHLYVASAPGEGVIRLVERRPWEPGEALSRYTVTVRATAAR
ncbi:MAG: protease inhibitor I42 family protein [Caulobacter sp.]|nr:protease inhibitor I42 family protein [Caulobacter sp.]MDP1962347.1 protease inhibitor I42 family protein [Reyranella sp.]